MRQCIPVSPEMVAFVGEGRLDPSTWPAQAVAIGVDPNGGTVSFHHAPELADDDPVVLVVAASACRRLFADLPASDDQWHLPTALKLVTFAIRDCPIAEPACSTFRLAKSIELLCLFFEAHAAGTLVRHAGDGELSELDTRRIVAARRLIDERWREKLTLHLIARACGLNRSKLTRGFRQLFGCTIADAITERRLGGARDLLLTTDLPVASVGYRCGYLNNASFTRAFARRFGAAPTLLRQTGLAA